MMRLVKVLLLGFFVVANGCASVDEEKVSIFTTPTRLDAAYVAIVSGVKRCTPIADGFGKLLARGDRYNDIYESAIVVSYPFATRRNDFYTVLLQQRHSTTKITIIQRAGYDADLKSAVESWIAGGSDCPLKPQTYYPDGKRALLANQTPGENI